MTTPAAAVPDEHDPLSEGLGEIPDLAVRDRTAVGPPPVVEGEVLTARPMTRETEARLVVTFAEGYAHVSAVSVVANGGRYATPVVLAFRAPAATILSASCGAGCTATTATMEGRIIVTTSPELAPGQTRTIALDYVTPTSRVAGNVRVTFPPRGSDTRVERVHVLAPGAEVSTSSGMRIGEAGIDVSPFAAVRLVTRVPQTALVATRTTTENGTTIRIDAPSRTPSPLRIALLVDGSPSTLGAARNAIARAVPALIERLPTNSEVRVVQFGAHAEVLLDATPIDALDVPALVARLDDASGTTTRLDRALALLDDAHLDRVIVLGDGGIARLRDDTTLALLHRHAVTYVLLGARPPGPVLAELAARGRLDLVDARSEGLVAVQDGDRGPLADRLETALGARAPVIVRDGRATSVAAQIGSGESLVLETASLRPTLTVAGRRVSLRSQESDVRIPLLARVIPTEPRPLGRDLPRETILEALRRQFIPPARLCLQEDRRGRAQHAIRAELVVRLADREVTAIEVNGELATRLRTCLGDVLEQLVLPAASAPMLVRYPIHTIEEALPPVIELDEETQAAVERTLGERPDER